MLQLTQEQKAILQSEGNIKINAVAGSGKTTTILEYAKSKPSSKRMLYLAFNRSVKLHAQEKFKTAGIHNVRVETAHSLAYKTVVLSGGFTIATASYKSHEIADILQINKVDRITAFIIAKHVAKYFSYYCNSNKHTLGELNYLETIQDKKSLQFVLNNRSIIEAKTALFWELMETKKINITHDFYLKKFQLSNPLLAYDFILFDEAQDASAAMIDVVLKQKSIKVFVGDTHQQIYGWRYAINSLEQLSFPDFNLSTSFRFSTTIASLAQKTIAWKERILPQPSFSIQGLGIKHPIVTRAKIGRTNVALLLKAIEVVIEQAQVERIYFEGHINSYIYAEDGASLYDVLNLYNGKNARIKDKLLRSMQTINDLRDYINKTGDSELAILLEIVLTYKNEIPNLLNQLKQKHVSLGDKNQAQLIFSTVHRSKGMEYDEVELLNDFIQEEDLISALKDKSLNDLGKLRLNEEVNLLYVGITRAKQKLIIPSIYLPLSLPLDDTIIPAATLNAVNHLDSISPVNVVKSENKTKAYSVAEIRQTHQKAYEPWTAEMDKDLQAFVNEGYSIQHIALILGRSTGSIRSRITKKFVEKKGSHC